MKITILRNTLRELYDSSNYRLNNLPNQLSTASKEELVELYYFSEYMINKAQIMVDRFSPSDSSKERILLLKIRNNYMDIHQEIYDKFYPPFSELTEEERIAKSKMFKEKYPELCYN